MFYVFTIIICMALIVCGNVMWFPKVLAFGTWDYVLWTSVCTLSVIVIDGIFATIVRRLLPSKWFSADKTAFKAGKKECRFYEKIGIKKWKDKVIELGAFTSFRKNKIYEPNSAEYIERYIIEANFGIVCHLAGIIFGFIAVFCCPKPLWLSIGLPVVLVNVVLSALPTFILRYNLPKLHVLYKFNLKKRKISDY